MSAHRMLDDLRTIKKSRPLTNYVITAVGHTSDDTPATVGSVGDGLVVNVEARKTYKFRSRIFLTVGATGGVSINLSGNCTASLLQAIVRFAETTNITTTRVTALDSAVTISGATAYECVVEGIITTILGGTLTIQFAQKTSDGTESLLEAGSWITAEEL